MFPKQIMPLPNTHPQSLDHRLRVLDDLVAEIRHPDISELEEGLRIFLRLPRSAAGYTIARPSDCRRLTEGFEKYLNQNQRLFQSAADPLVTQYFNLIEDYLGSDIRSYPNEVLHLQLVHAEALMAAGRWGEAQSILHPMAERPYLIEGDFSHARKILLLDTQAKLGAGLFRDVRKIAYSRLLYLARWKRRQAASLFIEAAPSLSVGNLWSSGQPFDETLTRTCSRILTWARIRGFKGLKPPKPFRIRSAFILLACWASLLMVVPTLSIARRLNRSYLLQVGAQPLKPRRRSQRSGLYRAWRRIRRSWHPNLVTAPISAVPTRHDTLVTRAMGGLGDILMMTPGLHALAQKRGRPVFFATKKQFFPLLENNPDVRLLDIDSEFDVSVFRRWVNLSICPAAQYESRVAPKIRKGRVELFARKMGIRRSGIDQHGWKPVLLLSESQQQFRAQFREQTNQLNDTPIIGVQHFSRELYRSVPNLLDALTQFHGRVRFVVFHNDTLPLPDDARMTGFFGKPLRDTIAAVAACDYIISVDSALVHLSAAFDIPTLAIFGPTDGKLRTEHLSKRIILEGPTKLPCSPCWRNEDIPCYLSRGTSSACLQGLDSAAITHALTQLIDFYQSKSSNHALE